MGAVVQHQGGFALHPADRLAQGWAGQTFIYKRIVTSLLDGEFL